MIDDAVIEDVRELADDYEYRIQLSRVPRGGVPSPGKCGARLGAVAFPRRSGQCPGPPRTCMSAADKIICTVERKSPEHVGLGQAIHELRLDAGVSQEELARRAGMHRTYIGGIERGERNVSFANLLKIADALSERPSKLLARCERLL